MANGVNISDITRTFSDQEWASLSSENRRHVHEERERRRNTTEGPAREIHAATAATAVTDGSSVTFDKEPPPDNKDGGAGQAAGFGHGAYHGRERGGGRGCVGR